MFRIIISLIFLLFCVHYSISGSPQVKVGADQRERYFPLLKGKSVGLVVNHTLRVEGAYLGDFLTRERWFNLLAGTDSLIKQIQAGRDRK